MKRISWLKFTAQELSAMFLSGITLALETCLCTPRFRLPCRMAKIQILQDEISGFMSQENSEKGIAKLPAKPRPATV